MLIMVGAYQPFPPVSIVSIFISKVLPLNYGQYRRVLALSLTAQYNHHGYSYYIHEAVNTNEIFDEKVSKSSLLNFLPTSYAYASTRYSVTTAPTKHNLQKVSTKLNQMIIEPYQFEANISLLLQLLQ